MDMDIGTAFLVDNLEYPWMTFSLMQVDASTVQDKMSNQSH